jgi:hypothetical protein
MIDLSDEVLKVGQIRVLIFARMSFPMCLSDQWKE